MKGSGATERIPNMAPKTTRTQILDAAQQLIQRLGPNAMSYQDISEAVGIRKASIHYYFPSKEDLLDALLERYSAYFLALVDDIVASEASAAAKLKRYVGIFEATLRDGDDDRACLCGMLGAELATLGAASVKKVRSFYLANQEKLARILSQGRDDGSFRFAGSPQATAALIFALLEGAVLISRARDGTRHFNRIAAQLQRLLRG